MSRFKKSGFTVLELITVMAIVAILLAAGVPALKTYIWNLRMKTAMDELQTDLNLTRGRAISHNIQTIICPSTNNSGCSGGFEWQNGWIMFTDLNGDRARQVGEPVFKQSGRMEFLTISSSRSRSYLRFYPNGTAPGSNITILFCDSRGANHAGKIVVSNSGRIRSEVPADVAEDACV